MQELEKRIGLLRLLLADVKGKQAQLDEMERQYRSQLSRIVEFVVYREGDVSNALSLMSEVQSKLDEVLHTAEHLRMINDKATVELDVLVLTKRVADARSQLTDLQARQNELSARLSSYTGGEAEIAYDAAYDTGQLADINAITEEVAAVADEIARLNSLISEASVRAARTVRADGGGKG